MSESAKEQEREMSELAEIKARATERRNKFNMRPNYPALPSYVEDAIADLERAIAIAEVNDELSSKLHDQAMNAVKGEDRWREHAKAVEKKRDEAIAKVEWYERGDQAELDGYGAAMNGVPHDENPYSQPEQGDEDRRHYDWLDGWERGNTEKRLEKAIAAVLKLRKAYAEHWVKNPRNPVLDIIDAVQGFMAETESYEDYR